MRPEQDEKGAEKVASLLVESGVSTVVINACRSAAGSNEASNIASILVQSGVKTAIGMSFNVLSLSADRFMRDFYYHFFVQAASPVQAVSYARGELRRDSSRLSKYHTNVNIEDHLVPIIHCQESELSNFLKHVPEQMSEQTSDDVHTMPSSVLGREGDILRLEWMLSQFERHRVHLRGHPGLGKTSLLKEAIAWWQKTGLFQQVIYIQLTDPHFQNCTTETILKSMAKQSEITTEDTPTAALVAALNCHRYLLVLDSLDSIGWSSSLPKSAHEHQLWMCLKKLKSCSVIVSSRTADLWLGTAIQSWLLLEPVDVSNAIAIGTGLLQNLDLSSKLISTQDDQSYFEQLIAMSKGNPLAIKVFMYDLAKHFVEDPSMTLESHLMSLLRLRHIYIDIEKLSYEEGGRAIAEIFEWIYEDISTDSELYKLEPESDEVPTPSDQQFSVPIDSLESLRQSIRTIRRDNEPPSQPVIGRLRAERQLARSGLYSAMIFNGFWHNISSGIEPFVTTLAALIVTRRFLKADAFAKFRTRLCEYTEDSTQRSNYAYDKLLGKSAFGLSPLVAHYCLYAATKGLAKVYQVLSEDLCQFVNSATKQDIGTSKHHFTMSYYSINPLVSLVSQSSTVKALFPQSLADDIEVARDALYRHRVATWLEHRAKFSSSPFNDALKMELDYDFYNYLCLMLSYQQLDSWSTDMHWQLQYTIIFAAMSDPSRLRLVERVLNRFINKALQLIRQFRQKYHDAKSGGYEIASQEKNRKDWSMATDLELACTNALMRAITCKGLLHKPINDYLGQWNYVKSRPMFLHWKYVDPTLREVFSRSLILNTRWFHTFQSGGKSLDVKAGKEMIDGLAEMTDFQRKFLSPIEPTHTVDTSLTVPAQIMETGIVSMGGRDLLLSRARKVVHRLGSEKGRVSAETLTKAAEDLEKLLLEEIEDNNSIPTRIQLHTYLAYVHNGLGNMRIAVQHRTIKEELKTMLEPEAVDQIERSSKLWTSYLRDSHRVKGEPVNEAERLEKRLDERRAKLLAAEAEDSADELNILSCVEAVAHVLRDLGRDAEAAEHYERVIQGRQRLLPANDKETLSVIHARSKLLSSLRRYDESIPNFRTLQREYAALDDHKVHNNVRGSLGLELLLSVRSSGDSLPEIVKRTRLVEAKDLLEASAKGAEEIFEPGDFNISASLSSLASLYAYEKDYDKAEACYKSAIRVHLTRTSTEANTSLILSRNNLACLWKTMHKYKEAEDLFSRLLETCIEEFEMWHKTTLLVASNLYDLYDKMGPTGKARAFIQDYISRSHKSLEGFLQADMKGSFGVNHAKYQIGRTLALCDAYEEAIVLLEEVAVAWRVQEKRDDDLLELLTRLRQCYFSKKPPQLQLEFKTGTELIELRRELSGSEHAGTLNAIEMQVTCLRRMNRLEEAVEMQLPLVQARKAGQGVSQEQILNNVSYLAELYEEMEDWPAALSTRQEVYESRKTSDPNDPKTIAQASRVAIAYENLLDWERVAELRRNEVEAWRKLEGPDSKNALVALVELGSALEKLGRYDEANPVIDSAIEGRTKILGPAHFKTLLALRIKAIILRSQNRLDESEVVLNGVLSTRAQHPSHDSTRCRALAALSKVHQARGRPDRAIEFLREAVDACAEPQGAESVMRAEDLLPDLAREYAAARRWGEAEEALDRTLVELRSRQATRATARKIEECVSLREEFRGRKDQTRK